MKKKIIGIAIVTIAAVGAAWNLNVNKDEVTISDLALENVEALAQGESGGGKGTLYGNSSGTQFCCCSGSNSCGAATCSKC